MQFDQAADDRQPKAGAALLATDERFKQMRCHLGRNGRPVVGDHHSGDAGAGAGEHQQPAILAAFAQGLAGIAQHIAEDRTQVHGIRRYLGQVWFRMKGHLERIDHILLGAFLDQSGEDGVDVHRLGIGSARTGKGQEGLDDRLEVLAAVADARQAPAGAVAGGGIGDVVEVLGGHQLGVQQDHPERVFQLVHQATGNASKIGQPILVTGQ